MIRSGAGVGVLNGCLYAVGGHDGPVVRKSVECFCPFDPESGPSAMVNGASTGSSLQQMSASAANPTGFAPHGSGTPVAGLLNV